MAKQLTKATTLETALKVIRAGDKSIHNALKTSKVKTAITNINAGDKKLLNASIQFTLLDMRKEANATNLLRKAAVFENLEAAKSKFNSAMQKTAVDDPVLSRFAMLKMGKALEFENASGEFFSKFMLPSGELSTQTALI